MRRLRRRARALRLGGVGRHEAARHREDGREDADVPEEVALPQRHVQHDGLVDERALRPVARLGPSGYAALGALLEP